jgi:hypothetical protein
MKDKEMIFDGVEHFEVGQGTPWVLSDQFGTWSLYG